MGDAGTSVGLWVAEGKAWVRRGRRQNGYSEWGEGSAAQDRTEAPQDLGAPETQLVITVPEPEDRAFWQACSPSI